MVETATAGGLLVGADRHDFTAGPIASIAAIEAISSGRAEQRDFAHQFGGVRVGGAH